MLRGALTRDQMIGALRQSGADTPVVEVMLSELPTVRLGTRLEGALKHLQKGRAPLVGVLDAEQRLAGYITAENVGELMMALDVGAGEAGRAGPLLPQ